VLSRKAPQEIDKPYLAGATQLGRGAKQKDDVFEGWPIGGIALQWVLENL
jgi:hypothetical protein